MLTIRRIKENEILDTYKLGSICFDFPYANPEVDEITRIHKIITEPKTKSERHWNDTYGAFDENNELAASIMALPYSYYFEGHSFKGNGIGFVSTYPHHRKKGAIKKLFQTILEDAYKEGKIFSYLYPFSECFYERFGYFRLNNSKCYDLNMRGIPDYQYLGTFKPYRPGDDDIFSDIKKIYQSFAPNYNIMVNRDEFDYSIVTDAKLYKNNISCYVYYDKEQIPSGYLIYTRENRTFYCKEFIFHTPDALHAIFAFIRSFSSYYDFVRCHFPESIYIRDFCTDYAAYPCTITDTMNGMVRVIHVFEVLKNATYIGTGKLTIAISDSQLQQNTKNYFISFENGIANSIIEKDYNKETADIALPISRFSAAIIGSYSACDFEFMLDVTYSCKIELLNKVFYKKSSFINNYF
ncbi:MAG: GNAT family N-acetyltransferase [Lachnospiraceae bacterium]